MTADRPSDAAALAALVILRAWLVGPEASSATPAASSLVPLREAGVSHRALLVAAKRGEITIHRRGKSSFVERAQLEAWITNAPRASREPKPKPDDVAELLDLNRERRRRAK